MYYFTLPDFFHFSEINERLITLNHNRKNVFVSQKIQLIGQDGNFPFFYWNGGQNLNKPYTRFTPYEGMESLNLKIGSKISLDCSNPFLEDTDFQDTNQNILLSLNENGSNEIIITNTNFLKYLKEKYPSYLFIGSPFYYLHDQNLEFIDDLSRIRALPCQLEEVSLIPKSKIELSITESCQFCPNYASCKFDDWNRILNFCSDSSFSLCNKKNNKILTFEEIQVFQKTYGIKYFYFDFSSFDIINIDIAKIYVDLFIKKDFQNEIYYFLKGDI